MILDQIATKGAVRWSRGVDSCFIRSTRISNIGDGVCKHDVSVRKYLLTNNSNVIANIGVRVYYLCMYMYVGRRWQREVVNEEVHNNFYFFYRKQLGVQFARFARMKMLIRVFHYRGSMEGLKLLCVCNYCELYTYFCVTCLLFISSSRFI